MRNQINLVPTDTMGMPKIGLFYPDNQTEIGGGWKRSSLNKMQKFLLFAVITCLIIGKFR
uniref:Uncharacterized protein n=1 Tax=OCS116 cluster bacterium TaxID=2030921 RepID=A0A2A4YZL9_9PROT